MALSNELISQFVKETTSAKKESKESTVYAEVTNYEDDGCIYARFDGADDITPVASTTEVAPGDRVIVSIKNHTATITGNLSSPSVKVETVQTVSKKVDDVDDALSKIDVEQIEAAAGRIDELETNSINISNGLTASKADIDDLKAKDVEITGRLEANEASVSDIVSENAKITGKVTANEASIKDLETSKLDADEAEVTYAKIEIVDASFADIRTLIFGSATGDVIHTSFANAVIAQLGDAQIKSAMIESVSADKIKAGEIITNDVTVRSEDGRLIISDETIQISDDNKTVRVQIGKDASNDYSINIWDADGNLMFSQGGITDKAIKNAIIRNEMVSDDANISASKLDIDSLFEEINGSDKTIKSTQIYLDDEKQTLNVAFKTLSADVDNLTDDVTSHGTTLNIIQGQITSKIWQQDIESSVKTINTQYSELKQTVDDFSANVSKTYATKDSVEMLEVSGRNLIVRRGELLNTYVLADGSVMDSEQNYWSATMLDTIRVEPGVTYTFSKDESALTYYFRWAWYDENMNVLGRSANDASVFSWTVPENAVYVRVSYPYTEGSKVKLEKGETATEYCPAIEDVGSAIDSVDARFDDYATIVNMEAAIKMESDNITSTVSKTYTTKEELNDLEIGASNLIKNSDFSDGTSLWVPVGVTTSIETDDVHGTCLKITSTDVGSSTQRIYPSTTQNFIHKLDANGKATTYSLSFYAKTDSEATLQTNIAGGTAGVKNYTLSTEWQRFTHTYDASAGSITFWLNDAGTTAYITKVKIEHGDKVTDWTPHADDIVTTSDLENVNTEFTDTIEGVNGRIDMAESAIQQLSDVISTLVTDENGMSLMIQTSTGWTFRTTELQSAITNASNLLDSLTKDLGDTQAVVDVLEQAVNDLNATSEYVRITTYQNGDNTEPCIELGEGDSEFKAAITNTRFMFMDGSVVRTYINRSGIITEVIRVESELIVSGLVSIIDDSGNTSASEYGYVWKVRNNGHMGLGWKGEIVD